MQATTQMFIKQAKLSLALRIYFHVQNTEYLWFKKCLDQSWFGTKGHRSFCISQATKQFFLISDSAFSVMVKGAASQKTDFYTSSCLAGEIIFWRLSWCKMLTFVKYILL